MVEEVKHRAQVQGEMALEGKVAPPGLNEGGQMPNIDAKSEWWKSAMRIIDAQIAQEIEAIRS